MLVIDALQALGDTEQRGTSIVPVEKIEVCLADAADPGISVGGEPDCVTHESLSNGGKFFVFLAVIQTRPFFGENKPFMF